MKKIAIVKLSLVFSLIISLLLVKCDKFTDVEFLTENDFLLDYSAREICIKTKDKTVINSISINGKMGIISSPSKLERDTLIHYDGYSVRYSKDLADNSSGAFIPDEHFDATEIIGKWFTIQKNYPSSPEMRIMIDENNEDADRIFTVEIGFVKTRGSITIKQKSKR
jgi:hypothetical protein